MSYLLFIDESGQDHKNSPYEVLAGICIEDRELWGFIRDIQDAEVDFFGVRITNGSKLELKGMKLLKKKTFRLAGQKGAFPEDARTALAKSCLEKGDAVTKDELTALGQAKIAFVERVLEICAAHRVKVFGSVVDRDAPRPEGSFLRKDYAYLFERFYSFLDAKSDQQMGFIVFDELDHSQCHILIDQMSRYFRETTKGRVRSNLIVPEPFFVHSHLTTAIQVADVVAYLLSWGVRVGSMARPKRDELDKLSDLVCQLRWKVSDGEHTTWSIAVIDDLRPRDERNGSGRQA